MTLIARTPRAIYARLITLAYALAFTPGAAFASTPSSEPKRHCQFPENPSGPGNFFEPPAWPPRLAANRFARPGIVRASHDHFYLFIAYRALAGMPLGSQAQQRLAPFDPCWTTNADSYPGYDASAAPALVEARAQWEARRRAAKAPKAKDEALGETPNCHADAFRTAARTLESRLVSYGNSADLRDWIAGQDAVFANCSGAAALPADPGTDAPLWLRQDRAYQQGAAALYKGAHDDAARRFDLIATDDASPWHTIAPYLAARADIRSALSADANPAALARARARLEPLANATEASPLRSDALRLLQMVKLKTEPRELLAQLDEQLTAAELLDSVGQDLADYAPAYYAGGGRERSDLPFAAWFSSMRGTGANAARAAQLWRESAQPAWLVAALTLAKADTPELASTLADAAAVPSSSPAYATVRYHMARLGTQHGPALAIVDAALAARPALLIEDANAMRRIGLAHATSLPDVARFLARSNAMGGLFGQLPSVDADGANVLNTGLTLDMLVAISQMPSVPLPLRSELATVAWTRAFILARPDISSKLAPRIKAIFPTAAPLVENMLKETDPVRRRAAGAMLLARFPGMVGNVRANLIGDVAPDAFPQVGMRNATSRDGERVNWWCSFPEAPYGMHKELFTVTPHFLTAAERKVLAAERAALASTPNATDYLAALVMAHAQREPGDSRLPEALSRLIRGDGGCAKGPLTKAMFQHLHKHFKRSAAAKRTPTHR